MLEYRCDTLKTHARIDRGRRQGMEFTLWVPVVLHEHQIPDLDIPIQIIIRTARRATRHIRTVIIEHL